MASDDYDRSKRAQLQRIMGEMGTVLPHSPHGTVERPAQGWYARLATGKLIFLGDSAMLAAGKIRKLYEA
jgi:hypothetical protein